jgi:hypothetical protein
MSRFINIVAGFISLAFFGVQCYNLHLARIFFSKDEPSSSIEFSFMACMCAMIPLLMCAGIVATFHEIKQNESAFYCAPFGLFLSTFVMSALAVNGKYLVFEGIPYTVALINLVSTAVLLCIIASCVIFNLLIFCCAPLFVCCCAPCCTPIIQMFATKIDNDEVTNDESSLPVAPPV